MGNRKLTKKNIIVIAIVMPVAIALGISLIAFIVHEIYPVDLEKVKILTNIKAGDLFTFIGSFLAFVGTTFLGIVALKQNKDANNVSQSMLRLQLDERRIWSNIERDGFRILVPNDIYGYSAEATTLFDSVNPNTRVEFNNGGVFTTSVVRFILPVHNLGSCPITRIRFVNFNRFFRGINNISELNLYNICIPSGGTESISIDFQKGYIDDEFANEFEQDRIQFIYGLLTTYISFNIISQNVYGDEFEQRVQIYPRFNEEDVFDITQINPNFNGVIELNNNTIINYPL